MYNYVATCTTFHSVVSLIAALWYGTGAAVLTSFQDTHEDGSPGKEPPQSATRHKISLLFLNYLTTVSQQYNSDT